MVDLDLTKEMFYHPWINILGYSSMERYHKLKFAIHNFITCLIHFEISISLNYKPKRFVHLRGIYLSDLFGPEIIELKESQTKLINRFCTLQLKSFQQNNIHFS